MTVQRQAAVWLVFVAALVFFLWLFSGVLVPFILGMALAYFLDPLADRLERAGLSRLAATIVILFGFVLLLVISLLIVVPVLVTQLTGFIGRLPSYVASLKTLSATFLETRLGRTLAPDGATAALDDVVKQATAWLGALITSLWLGGRALIGIVSIMVVTPVVAFYLLYDWDRMVARIDGWLPREHVADIRRIAREIDMALGGFLRGQGTVCVAIGVFYAVTLTAIGLNFGLLIGLVAGLIGFVPFVGSIVGFVLATGVALVQFWPQWPWIVAVVVIFAVGQFLEGNILQPRLVGSSIGLHPVWLMFALLAFGSLFGFLGLLLAVPLAAAIGVLVRFAGERYRSSRLYLGRRVAAPGLLMPPPE